MDTPAENWIYDFIEACQALDTAGENDLEVLQEHAQRAYDTDAADMRPRDAAEVYCRESRLPEALTLWVAKVLGEPTERFG
ncbi:MAG: hypothetical protein EOP39_20845 [Rubrivivax sp.]|nr:MAG: hypothetical protein EOP39_20845 [Rubrivivax sp.]